MSNELDDVQRLYDSLASHMNAGDEPQIRAIVAEILRRTRGIRGSREVNVLRSNALLMLAHVEECLGNVDAVPGLFLQAIANRPGALFLYKDLKNFFKKRKDTVSYLYVSFLYLRNFRALYAEEMENLEYDRKLHTQGK